MIASTHVVIQLVNTTSMQIHMQQKELFKYGGSIGEQAKEPLIQTPCNYSMASWSKDKTH
jgi:hypothetical protein